MNSLERSLKASILLNLKANKLVLLLGPRRVGKTSLVKNLVANLSKEKILQLNGEDMVTAVVLKNWTIENYKRLLNNYNLLVIDEAQKIPEIGAILKLMVDEIKGIKILVTGSSMFDLNNKLGEPLIGRKRTFLLYPFARRDCEK